MDHAVFDPSPNIEINCYQIGLESEPLIQVDSFLSGADILKKYAIDHSHFKPADNFYPGIRMAVPLIYTAAMAKNLRRPIQSLFGFDPRNAKKAVSTFSIVTQKTEELSLSQKIPHFDAAAKKSLAAVHYLTDDEDSGTAFYRHRKSGFEFVDSDRYSQYMNCVKAQYSNEIKVPRGYICGSTDEYEMIAPVTAKFNRLILYRGSSLHSGIIKPNYDFDPNPQTGRLTITSFLEF